MNPREVFARADATLTTARYGLEDLRGIDPGRKLSGFRNVVVFGRAVVDVLLRLRSVDPGLDAWLEVRVREVQEDPLVRYFYELRSGLFRRRPAQTATGAQGASPTRPRDLRRSGPPPPGALSFFVGDADGGSGWVIRLPDGRLEKYYVALPADIGRLSVILPHPPSTHLGQALPSVGAEGLAGIYVQYLENLVFEARAHFPGA
jgi:hypothetical protein